MEMEKYMDMKIEKNSQGRPALDDELKRKHKVQMYLNQQEFCEMRFLAKEARLGLSAYCKSLLKKAKRDWEKNNAKK